MIGHDVRALAFTTALALLVAAIACGDASGSANEPLTVWVFEERASTADREAPLAGVTIAFDPPGGGERVLSKTDADGHATFEADFTTAGAAVTVVSPDHVVVTLLDASPETARARPNAFGKPASDPIVVLPRADSATVQRSALLRGTIVGKREASTSIDLSASGLRRLGAVETKEARYELRVPRGRPFFLIGHETKSLVDDGTTLENDPIKSFRVELAAREGDADLDIDVKALPPLPLRRVHLRADVPGGGAAFGPGTRGFATVESADSQLLVAPIRKAAPSGDGRAFEIEMSVAETDIAPERAITRAVLVAPDGSRTIRVEPGIVADGTAWSDFLVPPSIAATSRSLNDPIPLDGFPPDADLRAEVLGAGRLLWILLGPAGGPRSKSLVFPRPVDDTFLQLFANLVAVTIAAQASPVTLPLPPAGEVYRREAVSRDVIVRTF